MEDERSMISYAMKVLVNKQSKTKKFQYHDKNFENEFKKEASILQKLAHPHIIKMIKPSFSTDPEDNSL